MIGHWKGFWVSPQNFLPRRWINVIKSWNKRRVKQYPCRPSLYGELEFHHLWLGEAISSVVTKGSTITARIYCNFNQWRHAKHLPCHGNNNRLSILKRLLSRINYGALCRNKHLVLSAMCENGREIWTSYSKFKFHTSTFDMFLFQLTDSDFLSLGWNFRRCFQ